MRFRLAAAWLLVAATAVVGSVGFRQAGGARASPASPAVVRVGATALSLTVKPVEQVFARRPELEELGRRLFNDATFSEPRGVSCASCHDPAKAFSDGRLGRAGLAAGSRAGRFAARSTPSLLYARYTPSLYLYQDDDSNAPEPRGGLFADGRSDSIADAVASPFLHADEMNNGSAAQLARKLAASEHADSLRGQFGAALFSEPARAMQSAGLAIQAYLSRDEMAPFSSRYDRFTRGEGTLNSLEMKGMRLFANPDKGNCASCHVFNPTSSNGTRSLFTDFGYDAVAAPRNRAAAVNRDPAHFDLGACETGTRNGWPDASQWCGYFKTPSLRNAATRQRLMHNGVFGSLREVVEFYATRATDPSRWYKSKVKFDDLPATLRDNVNVNSTPYNRREGSVPALDAEEVDAIVAFLGTLTDEQFEPLARSLTSEAKVSSPHQRP